MKVQIVLLSLVLLVRAEPNVYCGRRLAMALAMVCGYDEKRDTGAWIDRSQNDPYVRSSWLGEPGVGLTVNTQSNRKTDNKAWFVLPVKKSSEVNRNTGPWSAPQTQGARYSNKVGSWLTVGAEASHKQPWLAPHTARAVSRSKRQIVTECCLKACSEDELMAYC